MRKFITLTLTSLIALASLQARETVTLRKWAHRLYTESEYRMVNIPHDFQMDLPWEEAAGGARGFKRMESAWYKTVFTAPSRWQGQKVLIDFEGVGMQGDVWVNGKKVGEIDYGYLGGQFDITSAINIGEDNDILVQCTTGNVNGSRWYTGGGLFRPVRIIAKNPISVADHGLYVTTGHITRSNAEVKVQVEIEGFRLKDEDLDIKTEIFAPDGSKVAEVSNKAPRLNYLTNIEVAIPTINVSYPLLWSCEEPNLYKVRVSLSQDGKELDRVEEEFGIRTIEFSKEFGFRLNGKKVFLKGMANHHDLGALGAATYDGAIERMILRMKEFGYNHIRTSHNPYSESLLKLADKHGILVVDELYDKWMTEGGQYWIAKHPFEQSWYKHEREWIKRDRNHPCVIAWSFGNETQMQEPWLGLSAGANDWGETNFLVMKTYAQRFDNTRPFTTAQFPARRGTIYKQDPRFDTEVYAPDMALVTDFAALNYRFREYPQYLEHDPDLNIYQSEASTNELAAPYFGMDREHMIGLAYWGAIEYWGESNGWPKKGWNYSYFNSAMEPYPQAYLIRSAFDEKTPIVHLGIVEGNTESIEWNDIQSGKIDLGENWNCERGSSHVIYAFSNADEVELMHNGSSLGVMKNVRDDIDRRNIFIWKNVPYGNGGKLEAIARNGGREVARHSIETSGKAVALKAVAEKLEGELEYVRVYAVDSQGRIVRDAQAKVKFDFSADGEIVAIDNQDHYTDELFNVNPKDMHRGFVMAIVRKGSRSGSLAISSPGLKGATVQIDAWDR